jgi:hypothetical protein
VTHQTGNLKASFSKIFSVRLVPEKIKENLEVTQLTNESNRRSEGVIRRLQLKTQFAVFLPSKLIKLRSSPSIAIVLVLHLPNAFSSFFY